MSLQIVVINDSPIENVQQIRSTKLDFVQSYIYMGKSIILSSDTITSVALMSVISCAEMSPQWFDHKDIPFDSMWVDDRIWFPYMLAGKKFDAFFTFQGHHTVLNYNITERAT